MNWQMNSTSINGVLNLYKPKGITSQTAVRVAKRICGVEKAGHCGTLDPQATGVLPIMLGEAVKISEYLVEHDKHYRAVLILGKETDTEDITGNVLHEHNGALPSFEEVVNAVASFVGEYMQVPPMYSALKVDGIKLVNLARDGVNVEREPRRVTVYEASVTENDSGEFLLDVRCSRGTYIRTLCADIGKKLGCGACMGELERASVGRFDINASVTLEQLREMERSDIASLVTPIDAAIDFFPAFRINDFSARLIRNGCAVDIRKLRIRPQCEELFRLYDSGGFFAIAIAEKRGEITSVRQKRLFFINTAST